MNCVNEAGNTLPLDQFNTKEISFDFFREINFTNFFKKILFGQQIQRFLNLDEVYGHWRTLVNIGKHRQT